MEFAIASGPADPANTPYPGVRAEWRCDPTPGTVSRDLPVTAAAAVGVLRDALDNAVARALGSARRVGVLTGGGVDSSVMLALALRWAARTGGSAFAVALDFEAEGDDRPHLRAVEAHLGCEVLRVRPEDAAPFMRAFFEGADGAPFAWFTGPCEAEMMRRARANGADAVLSGVGGDELFDGDPRTLARLAARGAVRDAVACAMRMRGFEEPRSRLLSWLLRPLAVELVPRPLRVRRRERQLRGAPEWAGPTLVSVLDDEARRLAPRGYGGSSPDDRCAELATRPHRVGIAWLRHQEEILSGIPRRDPYLDLDLVRLVTSFPRDWLLLGARRRGLFREVMRDVLPLSVRERADKSAFEPAVERFVAAAGGLRQLGALADGRALAALGAVEPNAFRRAVSAFIERPAAEDWMTVWPALACEAFLRHREARA